MPLPLFAAVLIAAFSLKQLIQLLIAIAVVGFIVWFLVTYVKMPDAFKQVIIVIAALALLLYALSSFGLF